MRTLALRAPPCNIWHWRWKYLALGEMRVRNAITFTLCGASGDHEHKDEAINRCIYFGHHLDTPGHTWTHLSSLFSTARDHNHLALGTRWRGRGKKRAETDGTGWWRCRRRGTCGRDTFCVALGMARSPRVSPEKEGEIWDTSESNSGKYHTISEHKQYVKLKCMHETV